MSHTDLTSSHLHHPRPTPARLGSSNVSPTGTTRPGIQYPVTPPATRPSAPAPPRPEVRINGLGYPNKDPNNLWSYDSNSSPTMTRRSGKSSESAGTSPTYVGEHGVQYADPPRSAMQSIPRPAVLRQRSASSPEHLKAHGAYRAQTLDKADDVLVPVVPTGPLVLAGKPRTVRLTSGSVHFTPDNIFVSITSSHTLTIYNLTPSNNGPNAIMQSVRIGVVGAWPAGVKADNEGRGEWTVRFNENPWSTRGGQSIVARRMIIDLFSILALQGYSYLCSIGNTHPLSPPRHLFTSSPPSVTRFFALAFSLSKRKLMFIDAPSDINFAVSNALKHSTSFDVEEIDEPDADEKHGNRITEEIDEDEDTRRIYQYKLIKRNTVSRSKKDVQLFLTRNEKADMLLLLSQLLKNIATHGFRLDASIPLGPVGPLGIFGRREMWIFKQVSWKVDSPAS